MVTHAIFCLSAVDGIDLLSEVAQGPICGGVEIMTPRQFMARYQRSIEDGEATMSVGPLDFSGARFEGETFYGVEFIGTRFTNAVFVDCDIRGNDFSRSLRLGSEDRLANAFLFLFRE